MSEFFTEATNYAPDPGFESGTIRHDVRSIGAAGITDDTNVVSSPVLAGKYSLRLSVPTNTSGLSGGAALVTVGWRVAAVPGDTWSAACLCGLSTAGLRGSLRLAFDNAALAELATASAPGAYGQNAPERLIATLATAPAGTAWVRLSVSLDAQNAGATGQTVVDNLVLTKAATATEYFSGDSGGAYWSGVQYGSPSVRRGQAATLEEMFDWVPPYFYSDPVP